MIKREKNFVLVVRMNAATILYAAKKLAQTALARSVLRQTFCNIISIKKKLFALQYISKQY